MPGPSTTIRGRLRLGGAVALVALVTAAPAAAGPSSSSLSGRIARAGERERQLHQLVQGESQQIAGYQGQIVDLQQRLSGIESSLAIERQELLKVQADLRAAHARLAVLRRDLARDKKVLADQVVALYESPAPDIVTAVAESDGFAGMLEQVGSMRSIARQNAQATTNVIETKRKVAVEVRHLAGVEARHQRIADAMIIQRDQVAQLKIAVVNRQLAVSRRRSRTSAALAGLRSKRAALQRKLSAIQQREAAAAGAVSSGGAPFVPSGGSGGGFFPAAGTNYSVGSEPEIAARLNRLGQALGLHLIGISGYRSPQHSVEVGGFPNDPHTRGEASDTPGIEGVPESVLNRFGLTRPFGGAAEADHIQLL